MSALLPEADLCGALTHFRFGPIVLKKLAVATHDVH